MVHHLSYFLCATPRSGTTLLCDLLAATGHAGKPQSYYRQQDLDRRARGYGLEAESFASPADFDRAYLETVLRDGAGETGIFGLRVMWGTVSEMVDRLGRLCPHLGETALFESLFGPLVYVHVSRQDKVAQAISLMKAEQSGLWHLAADGSDRQRFGSPKPTRYDADRIATLADELERDDAAWDAFFSRHGIAPVRISYETLSASPQTELEKILAALSLPRELAGTVAAATSKMADAESSAWAARFADERQA